MSAGTVSCPLEDRETLGDTGQDMLFPLRGSAEPEAQTRTAPVHLNAGYEDDTQHETCAQPRYDQDSKYPPDRSGEAAGEHGRVWKIYRDRVKDIDDDMLESWNDTLNMLLVFAGLFSATCTAFLIESSKSLQPDWQQATAFTVFAIYAHLHSTGTVSYEVPNPMAFVGSATARWINGLWFTSLVLSLAAALVAILAKQWLNEFKSRMRAPASSPKVWALRHSAFKGGLDRWGVDTYISALPFLLHVALFLFLIGMWLFLRLLDFYISCVVMVVIMVVGMIYIWTGLAPLFSGDCPYITPMTRAIYPLLHVMRPLFVALIWITLPFGLCAGIQVAATRFILDIGRLCFTRSRHRPWGISQYHTFFRRILKMFTPHLWRPSHVANTSSRALGILRYRTRTASTPAFDQAKILASDEPLREASVLAWMIRSLPAEGDIQAALCAAGWLSAQAHVDYFAWQKSFNPLVHVDLQRAAVDVLDNFAARGHGADEETIANILRACLFVSPGPIELSSSTKKFLSPYMEVDKHDLRLLSAVIIHSNGPLPPNIGPRQVNIRSTTSELVALSAVRGRPCSRGLTRIMINEPDTFPPPHPEVVISTLESDILHESGGRRSSWTPRMEDDIGLRFVAALDRGLCHSNGSKMLNWERHGILSLYGAAVRNVAYNTMVQIPRAFHKRLRFTICVGFSDYNFSTVDLDAIGTLLLRGATEERACISPAALFNLLEHFQRRSLTISSKTLNWMEAAFLVPTDSRQLVIQLSMHDSARTALHDSHLGFLQPFVVSATMHQSAWRLYQSILPISDAAERLAAVTCAYTVQLLALHRRGYDATAQALLCELLPCGWTGLLISYKTDWRYHLALHAKVISEAWWTKICRRLEQEPPRSWEPCNMYPTAAIFVAEINSQRDCPDCAHDEIRIRWGKLPELPCANAPASKLNVLDPAVWDPPRPVQPDIVSGNKSSWYTTLVWSAGRMLRTSCRASDGGDAQRPMQPDGKLESGRLNG